MTPPKPDAFARAFKKYEKAGGDVHYLSLVVHQHDAIGVLKKHHARTERLVRRMHDKWPVPSSGMDRYKYGYAEALDDLLAALKEMRR